MIIIIIMLLHNVTKLSLMLYFIAGDFPSFSFSLSNLEPGDHTLTITFSDANFPDTTVVVRMPPY